MSSCFYNCTYGAPGPPETYADIAGLGVIIGFIATGYISFMIVLLYYLFGFDPVEDPFPPLSETKTVVDLKTPNAIDIYFLRLFREHRWIASRAKTRRNHATPHWSEALQMCVLTMSDLQLVTGLGILVGGFASLRCGISRYHWQMMVYLAWFSAVTHMASMMFLRSHFYKYQYKRTWRVVLMTLLIATLITAYIPTGINKGEVLSTSNADETFAICVFVNIPDGTIVMNEMTILSVLLLTFNYVTRVVKLHKTSSNLVNGLRSILSRSYQGLLLEPVSRKIGPNPNPNSWKISLAYHPLLGVFVLLRLLVDIWASGFAEVYFQLVLVVWGTLRLAHVRFVFGKQTENDWTFGQVIAIFLAVAPVFTLYENLYTASKHGRKNDVVEQSTLTEIPASSQANDAASSENEPMLAVTSSTPIATTMDMHETSSIYHLESPNRDLYRECPWFPYLVLMALLMTLYISAFTLAIIFPDILQALADRWFQHIVFPVYTLFMFTLCGLRLESLQAVHKLHYIRYLYVLVWVVCMTVAVIFSYLVEELEYTIITDARIKFFVMGGISGAYVLISLLLGWKDLGTVKWNARNRRSESFPLGA